MVWRMQKKSTSKLLMLMFLMWRRMLTLMNIRNLVQFLLKIMWCCLVSTYNWQGFCMVQVLSKKTYSIHGARSYVPSIYVIGHEWIQPILSSSFMGRAFKARRHGLNWGTFNLEMHGNAFSSFYGWYLQMFLWMYHRESWSRNFISSEQIHSSMETKVLEEYVHSFTCEKDKVF